MSLHIFQLIFLSKGVILSHENMVAATSAAILQLDMYAPRRTDVLFSFLPLAHTLERCCELAVFMAGGAIGFYSGNIKFAESDMKALKPTILPAVPKFLNKIYDACVTSVNKVRSYALRRVTLNATIFLETFYATDFSDKLVPTYFQLRPISQNCRN